MALLAPHTCKSGSVKVMLLVFCLPLQDYYKNKSIEHILILSGDQLYRMDYMELVQVCDVLFNQL